jgi:hypothetical protein
MLNVLIQRQEALNELLLEKGETMGHTEVVNYDDYFEFYIRNKGGELIKVAYYPISECIKVNGILVWENL